MRQIPLTRGFFALVDDEDYVELGGYNWQAVPRSNGVYARRGGWDGTKEFQVFMHRHIMKPPKGMVVDHIDGNPLNNCRSNLRVCTSAQNKQNAKAPPSPSAKPYRGVFRYRGHLYRAVIKVNYKNVYGPPQEGQALAARDYDALARQYHGEFARLNFAA